MEGCIAAWNDGGMYWQIEGCSNVLADGRFYGCISGGREGWKGRRMEGWKDD